MDLYSPSPDLGSVALSMSPSCLWEPSSPQSFVDPWSEPFDMPNPYEPWSSDESTSTGLSFDTPRTLSPAAPEDFNLFADIQPSAEYDSGPSHFHSHHHLASSPIRDRDSSWHDPPPIHLTSSPLQHASPAPSIGTSLSHPSTPPIDPLSTSPHSASPRLQPALSNLSPPAHSSSPNPPQHPGLRPAIVVSLEPHQTATTSDQVDITNNGPARTRPNREAALKSQKKIRDIQLQAVDVESNVESENPLDRKRRASDTDDEYQLDPNDNKKDRKRRKVAPEKQCSICPSKFFTRSYDCQRHMATIHGLGPTFQCLLRGKGKGKHKCNSKIFTRSDSLRRHWGKLHKTDVTYQDFLQRYVEITLPNSKGDSEDPKETNDLDTNGRVKGTAIIE